MLAVLIRNCSNVQNSWTSDRLWKGQQSFVKRNCALLKLTEGNSKNTCKEVPICSGR